MSSLVRTVSELFKYRALVRALVLRHLAARYRGSMLGFFWSILNPLCLMAVYTLVFKYYVRFSSVEHYALFLFCGLLPWTWTSSALLEGTSSIVASGSLITKSMFPAHLLPVVSVLTTMVNFLLSLPLLAVFMLFSGVELHAAMLLLPVVIALHFLFLTGAGLGLSALNVHLRDVQHILGNLLTFLFFLCPIVYTESTVPERYRFALELNPLSLLTLQYQRIILQGQLPSWESLSILLGWSVLAVVVGNAVFSRYRESFAESL